jgi:uncharacterized membrane protein
MHHVTGICIALLIANIIDWVFGLENYEPFHPMVGFFIFLVGSLVVYLVSNMRFEELRKDT